MKRIPFILLLLCLLPGVAWGVTYHMTATGAAAMDGSDLANAFGVTAFNAATFTAGDTVYMYDNAGRFTSSVTPPSSGTTVGQIFYVAATGETPVFDPTTTVTNWSTTGEAGVYEASTNAVIAFYEDDLPLVRAGTSVGMTAGQWYSVYPTCWWNPTSGATATHTAKISKGPYRSNNTTAAFVIGDRQYITIKGLTFQNCGIGIGGYEEATAGTSPQGVVIENNAFRYCLDTIFFEHRTFPTSLIVRDNTFYRCSRNIGAYGATTGAGTTSTLTNLKVTGNTFTDPGAYNGSRGDWQNAINGAWTDHDEMMGFQNLVNADVSDNTANGGIAKGFYLYVVAGVNSTGNVIKNNKILNSSHVGIKVMAEAATTLGNNWFMKNVLSGVSTSGVSGFVWHHNNGLTAHNYLVGNTIDNYDIPFGTTSGADAYLTVKNNIFSNSGYVNLHTTLTNFICDFNLYENNWTDMFRILGGGSIGTSDLTWWQGLGYDQNSVQADPLLVNTGTSNFTLQSTSPAIHTGTSAYIVGLEGRQTKSDGTSVSIGSDYPLDLGAYPFDHKYLLSIRESNILDGRFAP